MMTTRLKKNQIKSKGLLPSALTGGRVIDEVLHRDGYYIIMGRNSYKKENLSLFLTNAGALAVIKIKKGGTEKCE